MLEAVQRAEVFRGIPSEQIDQILDRGRRRTFAPGYQLMRQGDVGDAMYVIVRGRVRVERTHPSLSGPIMLAELGEGDVIGEMGLLDDAHRAATVTAIERTDVIEMTADTLRALLSEYPAASRGLLEVLTRRLRSTNALCEELLRSSRN